MKNKELRKQTWKYFWEQKVFETFGALFLVYGIAWFGRGLALWSNHISPENNQLTYEFMNSFVAHMYYFGMGCLGILISLMALCMILIVLLILALMLQPVIKWNWELAKKRAKKKLKKESGDVQKKRGKKN